MIRPLPEPLFFVCPMPSNRHRDLINGLAWNSPRSIIKLETLLRQARSDTHDSRPRASDGRSPIRSQGIQDTSIAFIPSSIMSFSGQSPHLRTEFDIIEHLFSLVDLVSYVPLQNNLTIYTNYGISS